MDMICYRPTRVSGFLLLTSMLFEFLKAHELYNGVADLSEIGLLDRFTSMIVSGKY